MKILITENQFNKLNDINNKIINDDFYQRALKSAINSFGIEDGKWELNWYMEELERLQNKGGEVYRIVFLRSIKNLKIKNIGLHWVSDKGVFSRVYNNIRDVEDEKMKPYLITAKIPSKFINIESSISAFITLPEEGEINLIGNPTKIKLKRYLHV